MLLTAHSHRRTASLVAARMRVRPAPGVAAAIRARMRAGMHRVEVWVRGQAERRPRKARRHHAGRSSNLQGGQRRAHCATSAHWSLYHDPDPRRRGLKMQRTTLGSSRAAGFLLAAAALAALVAYAACQDSRDHHAERPGLGEPAAGAGAAAGRCVGSARQRVPSSAARGYAATGSARAAVPRAQYPAARRRRSGQVPPLAATRYCPGPCRLPQRCPAQPAWARRCGGLAGAARQRVQLRRSHSGAAV